MRFLPHPSLWITISSLLLAHSNVLAQAQRLQCPQGLVELDVTPLLDSVTNPGICGPARDGQGCDDGHYALTAPPSVWPEGIPFGGYLAPSLYINANGALTFDVPLGFVAPGTFPEAGPMTFAAHLSDVDVRHQLGERPNPGRILLCQDLVQGRIITTWSQVGFFERSYFNHELNTYQIVLEKSDLVCTGPEGAARESLGVEVRYVELSWYASSNTGGDLAGVCNAVEPGACQPAKAGYKTLETSSLIPGSGTVDVNTTLLAGDEEPGVFRIVITTLDTVGCACPSGTFQRGVRCIDPTPSADAGDDQTSVEASTVTLSGTGSRDPQVLALTFEWTQTSGPTVTLTGDDGPTPSFVAPAGPSLLGFSLEVCNVDSLCDTDVVGVSVIGLPDVVTSDQTAWVGAAISLDASATTDPQGLDLTFAWSQSAGEGVTLTGPLTARPRFSAPEVPGVLVFDVEVCNSAEACATAECRVTVVCRDGFEVAGAVCADVDECVGNPCGANEECQNTPGAYVCVCASGFELAGESCVDTDECLTDPCDEDASCTNTAGAFTCRCDDGFEGDGLSCSDVDECQDSPCDDDASCTNADGAFTCRCDDGFEGDGFDCTKLVTCEDDPCDPNATCTDAATAFTCECRSGYSGDGLTCVDIDECTLGTDDCHASAECTNAPGTFSCACPVGTVGDPATGCAERTATKDGDDGGGCAGGPFGWLGSLTSIGWLLVLRRRRSDLRLPVASRRSPSASRGLDDRIGAAPQAPPALGGPSASARR